MKKYTKLKELLLDYTTALIQSVDDGNIDSERLADRFCSNNSLASSEPKPLANNKHTKEVCPHCNSDQVHISYHYKQSLCSECDLIWVWEN